MAKCLLFLFFLALALLPLLLPSQCQAYPLDIAKFLQRHRKTLHRLAQIRRRDAWDDSPFGGFGHFAEPELPDHFQSKDKNTGSSSVPHHHDQAGEHDGFGGFTDEDFGAFHDTPGFGDFVDQAESDSWPQEPGWDDGDPFAAGDGGFGKVVELPSKSDKQWVATKHKASNQASRSHHDKFGGGYVNKGFNDVVKGKSKADTKAPEWDKFKTAYRGAVEQILEQKCDREHVRCFDDADCYLCGPLYSCVSATCKVVSTSGDAESITEEGDKDWFDGGYFVDEPFDFGEFV